MVTFCRAERRQTRRASCKSSLALFAFLTLNGCGNSSVAPDPRVPPTTGPPDRLMMIDWNFGINETTCRAQATWGHLYSTSRDVTAESVWESSAPQVARVASAGRITSNSAGDAELRVTFRGLTASSRVRVFEGEPPLLVLESSNTTFVSGSVRDSSVPFPANGIEGANVEIISGHNAGIATVSVRGGSYYFYPPFVCGPLTARATKPGYREALASSVMCLNGMPQFMMTPE
jgi:hypothetical protein